MPLGEMAVAQLLITGAVAVVVSIVTALATSRYAIHLAHIKAGLDLHHEEALAHQRYEYQSRTRIYAQCEPLLFQIAQASEEARRRILNLALAARRGDLEGTTSFFQRAAFVSDNERYYYLKSTVYLLLAVPALFFLLREKLTSTDLALNESIDRKFRILKVLYNSFSDEFSFAGYGRALVYEPNVVDWREQRESDPARCWRQGLERGHLDSAISEMIVRNGDGERIRTFPEFSQAVPEDGAIKTSPLCEVLELFRNFSPIREPVLWRMLITQLALYHLLGAEADEIGWNRLCDFAVSQIDRDAIRWYAHTDTSGDIEISEALDVVKQYLEHNLSVT